MIKLYWGNSEDGYKEIGEYQNHKDLNKAMIDHLKQIGFKHYYFRGWINDEGFTMCDYGSHINFFKYKEE